jgi:hypothetical protein
MLRRVKALALIAVVVLGLLWVRLSDSHFLEDDYGDVVTVLVR